MIINLLKFIEAERPFWNELTDMMTAIEADPYRRLDFGQIKHLHYLYQRASADLAKINTFSAEQQIRSYLETLVARTYAAIHGARQRRIRFNPWQWFFVTFPKVFRRHLRAFTLSFGAMMVGVLFGAVAIGVDEDAKRVLMPFEYLQMDPVERVAKEEQSERNEKLQGIKGQFSAYLMTHNTRVSIFVLALGMTWGIGTLIVLFSNGVMLGAVAADYVLAGQTGFLMGWLLPHGVIEIPAILVAGQAGFVLAGALIGTGSAVRLRDRLRGVNHDVVTLIGGVAIMLVWAGLVEAFFSQYHEPVIPYAVKTAFGIIEFVLLMTFFIISGRGATQPGDQFRNKGIKGTLSYDAD